MNDTDDMLAAKVVESLRASDTRSRERLYREFGVYVTLDEAYRSGKLSRRIAPRCYGIYEGTRVDILFLELCVSILGDWGNLTPAEV